MPYKACFYFFKHVFECLHVFWFIFLICNRITLIEFMYDFDISHHCRLLLKYVLHIMETYLRPQTSDLRPASYHSSNALYPSVIRSWYIGPFDAAVLKNSVLPHFCNYKSNNIILVTYFHFQFRGILKKNYNSVDLTEVELLDDTNGPRKLSPDIEEVCSKLEFRKIIYVGAYYATWILHLLFYFRKLKKKHIYYAFLFYTLKVPTNFFSSEMEGSIKSEVSRYVECVVFDVVPWESFSVTAGVTDEICAVLHEHWINKYMKNLNTKVRFCYHLIPYRTYICE